MPPLSQELTEEQVAEIRDAFEFFDADGSGEIDKNEMHEAMKVPRSPLRGLCLQPSLPPSVPLSILRR